MKQEGLKTRGNSQEDTLLGQSETCVLIMRFIGEGKSFLYKAVQLPFKVETLKINSTHVYLKTVSGMLYRWGNSSQKELFPAHGNHPIKMGLSFIREFDVCDEYGVAIDLMHNALAWG